MSEAGVGHVLNAQACGDVIGESPIQPRMAGEFKIIAEISRGKVMPREGRWRRAHFNGKRKPALSQFNQRACGGNKPAGAIVADPAHGCVRAGAQEPIRIEMPAPEKDAAKCLGLMESAVVAIQISAGAHAGKKILRVAVTNRKCQ